MIASFFRSLERHGVESLLISGQATVLYGAATFSEAIDLWLHPMDENRSKFLNSLHDIGASYYKLTPPFTVENLQRGHGFHFLLPDNDGSEIFLDVMGRPPRVGSFAETASTARRMESEWGSILTIGLQALVELKKTQRLEDYPIISKLARAWFEQPECRQTESDLLWGLQNMFTRGELASFFAEHPGAVRIAETISHDLAEFGRQSVAGNEVAEPTEGVVGEWLQSRIAQLQRADRLYWREIIRELKEFRTAGLLLREGVLVEQVI